MNACGRCGQLDGRDDPLVAACDVLVHRALEMVGKRVLGSDRRRYADRRMDGRPLWDVHLVWQPAAGQVDKALAAAWVLVPPVVASHGPAGADPAEVAAVLDRYVRELIVEGRAHLLEDLRYRLGAYTAQPAPVR